MQNEQTLLDLGFSKDQWGEYVLKGNKISFIAEVIKCNGPTPYIQLYRMSDKIDERFRSPFKGKYFKHLIKDCCSNGSVERAINQYDI